MTGLQPCARAANPATPDKELAALKVAAKSDLEGLSAADLERLEHYDFLLYNSWEFSFMQNSEGTIPRELWDGHDGWMRGQAETNASFEENWKKLEHSFGAKFRKYINDLYQEKKSGKSLLP